MSGDPKNGYANGTLVGNWYEDRLDDFKNTHPLEHRMGRTSTTPIKMTRPVDDQYVSMNRAMHNWPVREEPPAPPKMVNFATVRHGAEAPVPAASYGSVLPRHGADRDLRVLSTTSHSVHGGAYADHPMMRAVPTQEHRADPTAPAAGKSGYEQAQAGSGLSCGIATGEMLKTGSSDIKEHTLVQRSWLYDRSLNQHYATEKRTQAPTTNVPGLALRGLGEASSAPPAARSFALANDTTRHDTGIWSG